MTAKNFDPKILLLPRGECLLGALRTALPAGSVDKRDSKADKFFSGSPEKVPNHETGGRVLRQLAEDLERLLAPGWSRVADRIEARLARPIEGESGRADGQASSFSVHACLDFWL